MNNKFSASENWRTSSQRRMRLDADSSHRNTFLKNHRTDNLARHLKNVFSGVSPNPTKQLPTRNPSRQVSTLKRKILDLKCRLSGLKEESTKKIELEAKIQKMLRDRADREACNRKVSERLIQQLAVLKGETEEIRTRAVKMGQERAQKGEDLRKLEELLDTKNLEIQKMQQENISRRMELKELQAERDSKEKEEFLLQEEMRSLELEGARLECQLQDMRTKVIREDQQSSKMQV